MAASGGSVGALTGGGAGAPGDALRPFADAVLAAAKLAPERSAGDPGVITALQLGWLMFDLIQDHQASPYPSAVNMPVAAGYEFQALRLVALLGALKLASHPDPAVVVNQLQAGSAAAQAASGWQPRLASALAAADTRFAKAYGLGYQLNALANQPSFSLELFRQPGVDEMLAALDDLSSALPAHASRGVANSLRSWQALQSPPTTTADPLRVQCELWRTLLVGDKQGTELLEPENYLDAAERLAAKLRSAATLALKRFRPWVALIVLLFLGGVAVLVLAPTKAGTTAAGLSGVLAALGLTWKGIGTTLGNLAGKLEAPLWGAELDGAITDAITLLPTRPSSPTTRTRRQQTRNGDYANRAGRATHIATRTPPQTQP
jgi:hypothetical protein